MQKDIRDVSRSVHWSRRWRRGPVLLGKLDTPEMRARREKFDTHASSSFGRVAQINYPAFLFFLGAGINKDQFGSQFQFMLQINQSPMSVDDDRLAIFAKFAPVNRSSLRANGNAGKNPGAAALRARLRF